MSIIGFNFLERHSVKERELGVDALHVIVDRYDWEQVVQFFQTSLDASQQLSNFIKNGTTNNSPVDAGERLHGSSKGKLQGDGEVQSGDERKERGDSDARESSSGDRQRPDRYDEVFQQLD